MTLSARVADDQLGQFYRRTAAIADRLGKSLDFDQVMAGLQLIHDGKHSALMSDCANPGRSSVLELVEAVELPAVESFNPKDKFREGKTTDGVKVYWLGDDFKRHFMRKTERDVPVVAHRFQKLVKDSLDAPILAELGDTAETTLAHFWEELKKQGNGQLGPLLVNGWANTRYIRDADGNLWAVSAARRAGCGWEVGAESVGDPCGWGAGSRVVSR